MPSYPPLDWREVTQRRRGGIGDPFIYRAEVDSTSALAARLPPEEAPVGAAIVADHQTAGRGRLGRRWVAAPNSGLACTVVLGPMDPPWAAPMAVGLALLETLEGLGLPASLKWPNDALIGGRKCAGILIETRRVEEETWLLGGIGINVHASDPALPQATHLAAHSSQSLRREEVLVDLLARLEHWWARASDGPALVRDTWAARLETLGRTVIVQSAQGPIRGLAAGVAEDGGLVLRLANGMSTTVWAGDVTLSPGAWRDPPTVVGW
ncbi:MAG TPA: biotin--[acetyl-CoA-carboxylase] ligase [Chloroflexota bacterium]|nr:biotin--[acetyl-CoA-carboxylase] ligase [Chloroflexota bacterium]